MWDALVAKLKLRLPPSGLSLTDSEVKRRLELMAWGFARGWAERHGQRNPDAWAETNWRRPEFTDMALAYAAASTAAAEAGEQSRNN